MSGSELVSPFAIVALIVPALFALSSIATSMRGLLFAGKRLHQASAACPAMREYSYRITEVVATWNDGKVVPLPVGLPVRSRQVTRNRSELRAAA